jgi:CubicO group peptidase (beta-lactamase class C family)
VRLTKFMSALIITSLLTIQGYAQDPASPDLLSALKQVDVLTSAEFAKDNLGSVTIGVVSEGKLIWTRSYGYADAERKIPARRETVYRIGSVTKQFTALMLLQLVEAGRVHFSDPVEKYFPEVNQIRDRFPLAPPITLIQLATHTAGIAREPDDSPTYTKGPVRDWEKTLIAALPRTKYAFEPGTRYYYSNIGYAILGAALSRAAKHPYVDYLAQHIFEPLGMSQTAFEPSDKIRPALAKGYDVQDGKADTATPEREQQGRGYKVPNGAMYSTVDDLARFVAFELGEGPTNVLKKAELEANFKRIITSNARLSSAYGVGFVIERKGELLVFGHGGTVAGYDALLAFERASKLGVIVLRNVSGGSFNSFELATQALDKLVPVRRGLAK